MDATTPPPPPEEPKGPHRFKKGEPRPVTAGRKGGSVNKTPRLLKEAIMMAAELEGFDNHGKDQLVGFLRRVAREDLRSFVMLLGRVLPLQVETKGGMTVEVTYRSIDEVRRELSHRGVDVEVIGRRLLGPPEAIDHDDEEDGDGGD